MPAKLGCYLVGFLGCLAFGQLWTLGTVCRIEIWRFGPVIRGNWFIWLLIHCYVPVGIIYQTVPLYKQDDGTAILMDWQSHRPADKVQSAWEWFCLDQNFWPESEWSLKGYVHPGFSVLQDAREHADHDPMWLTFGSAEFRETSANNALYLPFLGPVMPLLFYIGLGMIEDLADFPNQFLVWKLEGCVYSSVKKEEFMPWGWKCSRCRDASVSAARTTTVIQRLGRHRGVLSERWWLYSKLRSFQELGMLKPAFFFLNFYSFGFDIWLPFIFEVAASWWTPGASMWSCAGLQNVATMVWQGNGWEGWPPTFGAL